MGSTVESCDSLDEFPGFVGEDLYTSASGDCKGIGKERERVMLRGERCALLHALSVIEDPAAT